MVRLANNAWALRISRLTAFPYDRLVHVNDSRGIVVGKKVVNRCGEASLSIVCGSQCNYNQGTNYQKYLAYQRMVKAPSTAAGPFLRNIRLLGA